MKKVYRAVVVGVVSFALISGAPVFANLILTEANLEGVLGQKSSVWDRAILFFSNWRDVNKVKMRISKITSAPEQTNKISAEPLSEWDQKFNAYRLVAASA